MKSVTVQLDLPEIRNILQCLTWCRLPNVSLSVIERFEILMIVSARFWYHLVGKSPCIVNDEHTTTMFINSVLVTLLLTFPVPIPDEERKLNQIFFFHTFWCLKRFYRVLKGLHNSFCGTIKKCENKNLI